MLLDLKLPMPSGHVCTPMCLVRYVYRSKRDGTLHAILHNMWPAFQVRNSVVFPPMDGSWQCRGTTLDPTGLAGGHAFSEDGITWGYR